MVAAITFGTILTGAADRRHAGTTGLRRCRGRACGINRLYLDVMLSREQVQRTLRSVEVVRRARKGAVNGYAASPGEIEKLTPP
jgi:hypothetical protein